MNSKYKFNDGQSKSKNQQPPTIPSKPMQPITEGANKSKDPNQPASQNRSKMFKATDSLPPNINNKK